MNMSEIKQAVMRGNFSTSELQSLMSYIRTVQETQTKATLNVGDDVWVVQKTKRTAGVIKKVNIKRAIVSMQGGSYNVPLSMIEAA
jgi:ribosomal protein L14|tara:strand:+ start:1463 stop:1720 length:258 start_codon:yes stop_codon:yes gene_type:complete